MAVTRRFNIRIDMNGLNITTSVLPYIIDINIEDIFDTSFTPSKLSIKISSAYNGRWFYRDQLKVYVSWSTKPTEILETNTFYLDYIDDNKDSGIPYYTINAIEADPNIGFLYGSGGEITLTNKTVKGYVSEFATTFGLTVTESMGSNVIIGTIPIASNYTIGTPLPGAATVTKKFSDRPEILKYICNTYGYFGNISGTKLQIFRLETGLTVESDFTVPSLDAINSFQVESRYSNLYRTYTSFFARNTDDILDLYDLNNSFGVNTKKIDYFNEGAYWNSESGVERAIGAMYIDYLQSFRTKIECDGFPGFKSGRRFVLGESYTQYSGVYRCLRVNHRLSSQGWKCSLEAFPLDRINATDSSFRGSNPLPALVITPVPTFSYSQIISSSLPITINSTWLDDFARSLNSAYGTTNLGSTFLTECATEGIRADIAFCQMLVETNNWRSTDKINNKNTGGVGNTAGTESAIFTTWQTGIRAQVQHLFAYAIPSSGAGTRTLVNGVVDPRYNFVPRGSANKVIDLSGKWINYTTYGQSILEKMKAFYTYLGYKNPKLI
jgi:hypothetical protein